MEVFQSIPDSSRGRMVVLGTFDGLHRGHRAVLERGLKLAEKQNLVSTVLTFNPEPRAFFQNLRPEQRRLLTREDKLNIIKRSEYDSCVELEFTDKLAVMSPADFFYSLLVNKLNVKAVCVGYNFKFGARGQGTTSRLRELADENDVELELCPPVEYAGQPVSSSRIRELIKEGKMRRARELLTRPYTVLEVIQPGRGKGKELGFPTLNFPLVNTISPLCGVYLVWLGTERRIPAVANYGRNPAISELRIPVLEVHSLSGKPEFKVGEKTHVYFEKFVRREIDFETEQQLKNKICEDVEQARKYFAVHSRPEMIN